MDAIQKIREYVAESRGRQDGAMDHNTAAPAFSLFDTLNELQSRVTLQTVELNELKFQSQVNLQAAATASEDPRQKLQQLRAVKAAYNQLAPKATYLPPPGSILPALLAAQSIHDNIEGTKEAIAHTEKQLSSSEATLRQEEANLHDAHQLTRALESRIARLRAQQTAHSQKTPAQLARELIARKQTQKARYDAETQRLGTALNSFINDYLSSMLAAEELGGPVVGDMLDLDDSTLAAGFTKKGKPKSAAAKPVSDASRQKRIDQIWGSAAAAGVQVGDEQDQQQPTEAEAADAEMRRLIGHLFATLMGAGNGKAYLQMERDSAAVRFLVRAKIAQFHPRDAKKLRLIDFGGELED